MNGQQTGVGDIYKDFYAAQQAQNAMAAPTYPWVQASAPDHLHVGYDPQGHPIYRDRYSRFHYGSHTGYRPAPPPPAPPAWGLGDAPPSAPPPPPDASAAPAAPATTNAPIVVQPPAPVVVATPSLPQRVFHSLSLQHPAGIALITAVGAAIGGIAGQHLIPKTGLRLSGAASTAAGAAIGAGVVGGVATMMVEHTAHQQHADQTGAPPTA
jgi:hypothetical protein